MLFAPSCGAAWGHQAQYKYDLRSFFTLIKLILILKEYCMTIIKTMISEFTGLAKGSVSSLTFYGKTQMNLLANPARQTIERAVSEMLSKCTMLEVRCSVP